MNNFSRTDLRLMIQGLDRIREEYRQDLAQEGDAEDFSPMDHDGYNTIVRLQDRLIEALESHFY